MADYFALLTGQTVKKKIQKNFNKQFNLLIKHELSFENYDKIYRPTDHCFTVAYYTILKKFENPST